jgi:hypothetical protein
VIETQRERLMPVPRERGWSLGQRSEERRPLTAEELGPRTVGGVLDRAFEVLRAHFGLLMGAGLLLCVPMRILFFFELDPILGASTIAPFVEAGVTSVLASLLGALSARVFGAHVAGGDTSAARVLGVGPLEFIGILLLSALTGTLVGLGMCMLFVGMFIVSWLLALAPVVYMLETERRPLARVPYAIRRSISLVTGSFWRWLGLASVLGLLGIFLQGPLGVLDDPGMRTSFAIDWGLSVGMVDLAVCLLGGVFTALSAALSGVVFASFYFDQRARLEGVDLYYALQELEERQS